MKISNELLAAYAEGNITQKEREFVRQYLMEHPDALETVMIAMDDDYDLSLDNESRSIRNGDFQDNLKSLLNEVTESEPICTNDRILPLTAMAAQNAVDNLCVVRCEGYALRYFGIDVTDEELSAKSSGYGWQKSEGTALYNIGRLCGVYGLNVATHYNCSVLDIKQALECKDVVIAVINSHKLTINNISDCHGEVPNHAIIIKTIGQENLSVYDPATPALTDTYSMSHFIEAWKCSSYNLAIISNNDDHYEPHPIDLTDIALTEELIELREAIAENAHEVWAYNRKKEGWSYGPVRDDEKKTNPDLIPYNKLPDSEKLYDREMAMETIKLLDKLGWEVKKKRDNIKY